MTPPAGNIRSTDRAICAVSPAHDADHTTTTIHRTVAGTDMFMTQAWQCHLTRAAAAVRGSSARAACSVPDHDAVFVSLEPRRAGLLFAAVIHGRLRPLVAVSETPVGIRQSTIRARAAPRRTCWRTRNGADI